MTVNFFKRTSILNSVATSIGIVIKSLDDIEPMLNGYVGIENNKEELMQIAYICRVGIIDMITENPWLQNDNQQITISFGVFDRKKTTMILAMDMTIGRLNNLTSYHNRVSTTILDILRKGKSFYQLQSVLPPVLLNKLAQITKS